MVEGTKRCHHVTYLSAGIFAESSTFSNHAVGVTEEGSSL